MTIRQALNDVFFTAVGVLCCAGVYESCRQPQKPPVQIVTKTKIKQVPTPIVVTKVREHRYTFTKHDTIQTIGGYIVSPCDPETLVIGYSMEQRCTTFVDVPPVKIRLPILLQTIASPGSGAICIAVPFRRCYIGAGYDFINRGPMITYSLMIGGKK